MVALPVRLPYPAAPNQGSICENQPDLDARYFAEAHAGAALP